VTCPNPFVGDNVMFGPASNCVTPPFKAYEAVEAFDAHDDVPNKDPVIPPVTLRELKAAAEPLTMTRFQLGI
jgi:hypothetical protein